MAHRPGFSGTLLTLGLATAVAAGAISATLLVPDNAPAALESASALTEAQTQQQDFTDQRTVEVKLSITDPTPLAANTSGVVTALTGGTRREVTSGSSPLEVAGSPVLALHTSVPLYRDLESGSRGSDVRALQEELARLGYEVTADGYYGWGTAEAVRLLKEAIGVSDANGALPLAGVVWLPAVSVRPAEWAATLGSTVSAGGSYAVVPGQLTAVSLATAPSSLALGARTLTLWGESTQLDDQNRATDAAFLAAIAATDDYTATLAAEDPQNPTASLVLAEPLPAIKVPPTVLFAVDDSSACVQSGEEAIRSRSSVRPLDPA